MLSGILIITFYVIALYLLLRPLIYGAVYYRTDNPNLEIIKRFAGMLPGESAVDLGSGDGKILIAFAKAGAIIHGYEINPLLVWASRFGIKRLRLEKNATVHYESLWKADLGKFDVIIIYGMPYMMNKLEKKLDREAKPGARVISNISKLPHWQPIKQENGVRLYIR